MITSVECRTARALLGWSQDHLAIKSKVGAKAIRLFEQSDCTLPGGSVLAALQGALETGGVRFTDRGVVLTTR